MNSKILILNFDNKNYQNYEEKNKDEEISIFPESNYCMTFGLANQNGICCNMDYCEKPD